MEDALFGAVKLRANPFNTYVNEFVPLANDATIEWTQSAQWQSSHWEQDKAGITCVSVFKVGDKTATVRATGHFSRQEPGIRPVL